MAAILYQPQYVKLANVWTDILCQTMHGHNIYISSQDFDN